MTVKIHKWVVFAQAGESVDVVGQVEDYDVVSLSSLGAMHGREVLLCPVRQVLPASSEASQDQCAVVGVATFPDLIEGSSRSLALVTVGDHDQSAVASGVHARERASRLVGILLDETCGRLGDVVAEADIRG